MMKYFISSLFHIQYVLTLSRYNICRAVNFQLGILAEVAKCISARGGKWKLPNDFFLLLLIKSGYL